MAGKHLHVVDPDVTRPPRPLDTAGMALWSRVQAHYRIDDAGGIELLALACECLDRAERCRAAIDEDGEVIRAKAGPRAHPLLKEELANRAFTARTLQRLGLDVEPIRAAVGRPAKGFGVTG